MAASQFPDLDTFRTLPPAEQDRIRAEMAADTERARLAVVDRETRLRAAGATWEQICRDLRGDPTVATELGIDDSSTDDSSTEN